MFQRDSLRTSVELPIRLELFSYARRGSAIYDLSIMDRAPCFYRANLNPVRVESLGCKGDISSAFDLTVSHGEDFMLVSGSVKGETERCGVFELRLPALTVRQVLDAGDCGSYRFETAWSSLSVSPDGGRAVAVRHDRLELVDLDRGATRPLVEGILKAAWSPDGQWIAALSTRGKTYLIGTDNYSVKRTLAESEVQWSPDSRYLLRVRPCLFPIASNGVGTIEALGIATGERVKIASSKCGVGYLSTGWVSADVLK